VPIPFGHLLLEDAGSRFVQYFIGLDIDAPRPATGIHRALRFERQRVVPFAHVPDAVDDADTRVVDPRNDLASGVVRFPDIHDDLIADLERRANRCHDREVEVDGVANEGESRKQVSSGTAGYTTGGTTRRPRANRHACRAPRSALLPTRR